MGGDCPSGGKGCVELESKITIESDDGAIAVVSYGRGLCSELTYAFHGKEHIESISLQYTIW